MLLAASTDLPGVLLPVFAVVALGCAARSSTWLGEPFWRPAERLTYFALFPCLIATTLATAELDALPVASMATGIALAIAAISVAAFAARPVLAPNGPRFTSLYQGAVRMNTYIGLSVAARVGGEAGMAHAAVAIAVIVPLVNTTCVTALALYGDRERARTNSVVGGLVTNPLILASAVGVVLNVSGAGSPPVVGDAAALLGRAALPLGLLAVGAALRWEAVTACRTVEAGVCGVKLLLLPALAGALLRSLGVDGIALMVGVLFTALPTAPSSYLLARDLGGDAETMAALVSVQTLLALLTLPIALTWLA